MLQTQRKRRRRRRRQRRRRRKTRKKRGGVLTAAQRAAAAAAVAAHPVGNLPDIIVRDLAGDEIMEMAGNAWPAPNLTIRGLRSVIRARTGNQHDLQLRLNLWMFVGGGGGGGGGGVLMRPADESVRDFCRRHQAGACGDGDTINIQALWAVVDANTKTLAAAFIDAMNDN